MILFKLPSGNPSVSCAPSRAGARCFLRTTGTTVKRMVLQPLDTSRDRPSFSSLRLFAFSEPAMTQFAGLSPVSGPASARTLQGPPQLPTQPALPCPLPTCTLSAPAQPPPSGPSTPTPVHPGSSARHGLAWHKRAQPLWAELCPPNPCVETLTPRTSDCDYLETGVFKRGQGKVRLRGGGWQQLGQDRPPPTGAALPQGGSPRLVVPGDAPTCLTLRGPAQPMSSSNLPRPMSQALLRPSSSLLEGSLLALLSEWLLCQAIPQCPGTPSASSVFRK